MQKKSMLSQVLTVIRGDNHQRIVEPSRFFEEAEEPLEVLIEEIDLTVVRCFQVSQYFGGGICIFPCVSCRPSV